VGAQVRKTGLPGGSGGPSGGEHSAIDAGAGQRIRAYCCDIDAALTRVGTRPAAVSELLGSIRDDGPAFLVGSLAAGLGNRGSDIDVNVFCAEPTGEAPMMFFLGQTSVDVQLYATEESRRIVAALATDRVAFAGSVCALGPPPELKTQRRISRWLTACPFTSSQAPVFEDAEAELALAALVRGALENLVRAGYAALVLEPLGAASEVAWRRAGRAVIETLARGRGDVFIGEKWLVARAARCGVDRALVRRAFEVSCSEELAGVLRTAGLPQLELSELVSLAGAAPLEEFALAGRSWTLLGGARLLPGSPGDLSAERLASEGGPGLAEALAEGALAVAVDHHALDEVLRSCAA
jgi:hypothetical protein